MKKVYKNQLPKSLFLIFTIQLQNHDDLKQYFTKHTKMNMGRNIFPPGGYLG